MKIRTFSASLVFLAVVTVGVAAEKGWSGWGFLIGEWIGEGNGQPGRGTGGFTFAPDLQGRVLVRKSHADYPATDKRPAYAHVDLMVVHHDGDTTRADYYDNEGHVIRYTVELAPTHDTAVFVSEPNPAAPQFRLTYTRKTDAQVAIKFEIAPPGKAFMTYLEASAHRK